MLSIKEKLGINPVLHSINSVENNEVKVCEAPSFTDTKA